MLQPASVSRLPVLLEVANRGSTSCELVRHLSPLTVSTIMKNLPLQDRVHKFADKFVYIETGLTVGAEKQRTQFRRGEIAYMTSNGSICFFVKDSTVSPMNPIGAVKGNLEAVESSQAGDVLSLKKPSSA